MHRRLRLSSTLVLLVALSGCSREFAGPRQAWAPPSASEPAPTVAIARRRTPEMGQDEVRSLLAAHQFATLDRHFSNVQRDYVDGLISDVDLRNAFRVFYPTDAALEPKYDAWVGQFPRSYVAHLARGIYLKRVGAARRGDAFIDGTSIAQLIGMSLAYRRAAADFHASASLDAKPILTYMHAMDISRQYGHAVENRQLLDLSVRVDPMNFIVRQKYMLSLEPRWGGSMPQMRAFLEECSRANLPDARLRQLKAVIVADQADMDYFSGRYAPAASEYREAIQLGGETPCLVCAGYAMATEKRYADAVQVYSQMLAANPADPYALSWRAYAYAELQDPRAIADFTAAANLGSTYSQVRLGRYNLEGVPGIVPQDRAAAIAWFRKAAEAGDPEGARYLKAALSGAALETHAHPNAGGLSALH